MIFKLKKTTFLLSALFVTVGVSAQNKSAQVLPYKNPKLSIDLRVKDLVSRMTPEEKFWQLFMIPGDVDGISNGNYKHGLFGLQVSAASNGSGEAQQMLSYNITENAYTLAQKINTLQKYFVEKTRLGIPMIAFDEALHGLVRQGSTSFPQAIGLSAGFDTEMMHQVANAIAAETKMRGIRDVLTPVVNIASDVRWGRTEETYGEDPYLTSKMGLAFVSAFEKQNIITTPKHFVANVGDGGRDSYPIHYNNRLLEEIYFPPFKTVFTQGKSRSVMTAYNSLDGTPATSSYWLLTQKLKKEWGFKGFVISDAGAVGGANVLHNTAASYQESTIQAINGGLDVIFQVDYNHYKLFIGPFLNGAIPKARIDDAVSRVLRAKFELGLFENPYVSETEAKKALEDKRNKELAKKAALQSFVLLKNEQGALPLKQTARVLLVGEDATEARLGGYSGSGNGKISILDGLKNKAGKTATIDYAAGCTRKVVDEVTIAEAYLSNNGKPGLQGEYFDNLSFSGSPKVVRQDEKIDFSWTLYSPDKSLPLDNYAVRWSGVVKVPTSGTYKIGLAGNDGYRLYIDDVLLVDRFAKQSFHRETADFKFEQNKAYNIRVEFKEPQGNGKIRLIWNYGLADTQQKDLDKAVAQAKNADVIVVTAGITEGEFLDRAMLSLPGNQEKYIKALAKTGKPVIVLLVGGSAITMNNWINDAAAILNVWYPGEEGGNAVAETLFGDYNPAGRLPITYPVNEAQLPLVYNHKPTGRGDDYNNLSGQPLFPFGYGLSYTTFLYSDMTLAKKEIKAGESTTVSFILKNTGSMDGEEVVQLYLRDVLATVVRPVLELKGFERVKLKAGESKTITFNITPDRLQMLNANMKTVIEPGDFRIMIGSSSRELQLKETLKVKP